MTRKYLEDAGVDIDTSIEPLLSEQDNRYPQWVEENDTYGFSSPELWNLDRTMLYKLYERLCMWQENGLSGEEDRIVIDGHDATLEHWVNEIMKMCQDIFNQDNDVFDSAQSAHTSRKVWNMWAEISPMMWVQKVNKSNKEENKYLWAVFLLSIVFSVLFIFFFPSFII